MDTIMSSKLFTTRQGTVLLGVIAAVIAGIALLVYLNHYRGSVGGTVEVVVAKRTIEKGTPGNVIAQTTGPNAYFQISPIPKAQVESGAITDTSQLANTVALQQINPSSQLTTAQFGAGTGLDSQLNKVQRAVVVDLGSPQSVGGQITAGSHVDVWVTSTGQGAGGATRPVAKLLFQDMYVMNAATNGGNVTLRAETPKQAGQIIYAATNDTIWLVLRNSYSTSLKKPPVVGAGNVTGG